MYAGLANEACLAFKHKAEMNILVQVIGGDPDKDIAVLQLQAPEEKLRELRPVTLGTSTNLLVGQKVSRSSFPTLLLC